MNRLEWKWEKLNNTVFYEMQELTLLNTFECTYSQLFVGRFIPATEFPHYDAIVLISLKGIQFHDVSYYFSLCFFAVLYKQCSQYFGLFQSFLSCWEDFKLLSSDNFLICRFVYRAYWVYSTDEYLCEIDLKDSYMYLPPVTYNFSKHRVDSRTSSIFLTITSKYNRCENHLMSYLNCTVVNKCKMHWDRILKRDFLIHRKGTETKKIVNRSTNKHQHLCSQTNMEANKINTTRIPDHHRPTCQRSLIYNELNWYFLWSLWYHEQWNVLLPNSKHDNTVQEWKSTERQWNQVP